MYRMSWELHHVERLPGGSSRQHTFLVYLNCLIFQPIRSPLRSTVDPPYPYIDGTIFGGTESFNRHIEIARYLNECDATLESLFPNDECSAQIRGKLLGSRKIRNGGETMVAEKCRVLPKFPSVLTVIPRDTVQIENRIAWQLAQ